VKGLKIIREKKKKRINFKKGAQREKAKKGARAFYILNKASETCKTVKKTQKLTKRQCRVQKGGVKKKVGLGEKRMDLSVKRRMPATETGKKQKKKTEFHPPVKGGGERWEWESASPKQKKKKKKKPVKKQGSRLTLNRKKAQRGRSKGKSELQGGNLKKGNRDAGKTGGMYLSLKGEGKVPTLRERRFKLGDR